MKLSDGSWALRPIEDNSDGRSSFSAGNSFSELSESIRDSSARHRLRHRRGPLSHTSDGSRPSVVSNSTMSEILRRGSYPASEASGYSYGGFRPSYPTSRASEPAGPLPPRMAQASISGDVEPTASAPGQPSRPRPAAASPKAPTAQPAPASPAATPAPRSPVAFIPPASKASSAPPTTPTRKMSRMGSFGSILSGLRSPRRSSKEAGGETSPRHGGEASPKTRWITRFK